MAADAVFLLEVLVSANESVMSQRERFEHWFSDQGKWPQAVERSGEGYKLMQAQSAWETWKVACPEGWQAVPVEPTDEMLDCAFYPGCAAIETWREMRSAAPKPEDACKSPG